MLFVKYKNNWLFYKLIKVWNQTDKYIQQRDEQTQINKCQNININITVCERYYYDYYNDYIVHERVTGFFATKNNIIECNTHV